MLGAICGDVIGRPFEFDRPVLTKDFPLFSDDSRPSDDSILTVAVAHALLTGTPFWRAYVDFGLEYREHGFAPNFERWLGDPSAGNGRMICNGAAMRVSSIAWLFRDLDAALMKTIESAKPTHDSNEGIIGALGVTAAIRMALDGLSPAEMRVRIETITGYKLPKSVDAIRDGYKRFKWRASNSVPQAIVCGLEATSYKDAVRNAVSLGNDADTQAAIAGAIAEARFGIPSSVVEQVLPRLPARFVEVIEAFWDRVIASGVPTSRLAA